MQGHRHRMGDERVAAGPLLAPVLPLGHLVGLVQQAQVGLGMGGPVGGDQRLQRGLGALAVAEGMHRAGGERAHAAAERPLWGGRPGLGHLGGVRHGTVDLEAHWHLTVQGHPAPAIAGPVDPMVTGAAKP